jgi:hypothetical protein
MKQLLLLIEEGNHTTIHYFGEELRRKLPNVKESTVLIYDCTVQQTIQIVIFQEAILSRSVRSRLGQALDPTGWIVQHKESLMDHLAQVRTKAILQERKFRCQ